MKSLPTYVLSVLATSTAIVGRSALGVDGPASVTAQTQSPTVLVSTGSVWKYLDTGVDQGTAWIAPLFDDNPWLSGPAELGFGDGGEATTNAAGHITYYYRHTFNVADAASITNLRARLLRDDGAVVYLDGVEVFRSNMPTGAVDYLTLAPAVASDDGTVLYPYLIDPALLVNGDNVMAVEVHQQAATSSDISFALELVGNPLPLIAINGPTNLQVILGDVVTISGTATPGGDRVTLIEAFAGSTKVGESTNATFTIPWVGVAPGAYTLRARVIDNLGLVSTSAPVSIVVQTPPASVLVPSGSIWRYLDTGADQGTTWRSLDFNDSSWKSGPAELGYGDGDEATVISYGPDASNKYVTSYFRRLINVNNPAVYTGLTLTLTYDDGAVVYINGVEVFRINLPDGPVAYGAFALTATEYTPAVSPLPTSVLGAGTNVIAVEMHQGSIVNSDVSFDLQLEGTIDITPPTVIALEPSAGSVVQDLSFVRVTFDDAVAGVDASDLLLNGVPATNVLVVSTREYTFYFPQPSTGTVQVAWAANHGITDVSPLPNPFAGGSWDYTLDPHPTPSVAIISEFMAANANGIADEDGTRADWIEIYNPGPLDMDLEGWCLTDEATNLTQWRFPGVILGANKYLLVWASAKDRTNPAAPLHTNFRLEKDGEFLALSDPAGNIVSAFAPAFPPQRTDISYGRDQVDPAIVGYFLTPTPGAPNALGGPDFAPDPVFSLESGVYTNDTVSLTISAPAQTTIRYTLDGSLPGTNSPVYTGPMVLGNNVVIKARVFQDGLWPSRVLARSFIFLDASTRDFNSNLPILIVSTGGRAIPENVRPGQPRMPGSIVALDTTHGRSALRNSPQFQGLAEFEVFGSTATSFAKPPLMFEIQDELRNDRAVPLLGLPAEADWRLRNPYNDKTYLNDFLAPELHEKMGRYAVRRKFVEVFIDQGGGKLSYPGDYFGVFILLERIERSKNRINIAELAPSATNEPAITGGYMFKKDKDSVGDINFATTGHNGFPAEGLKIHEPKPNELRTTPGITTSFPGVGYTPSGSNQLRYLRNFLNRMETNLYANDWLTRTGTNHYSWYLDVDSFVDQHWIVEFAKAIDGYRLSTYFIKDRSGKVRMEPIWGWNLSFGNANYLQGGKTTGWYFAVQSEGMTAAEHIWLRRLINGNPSMGPNNQLGPGGDPDFNQKIVDRWSVLRTNILNATRVLARIDELSLMLSEAANRDLWGKWSNSIVGVYQWAVPNGPPNWDVDYQNPRLYRGNETNSIIGQMKKWVLGRYLWIDSQFTPAPTFNHPGGDVTNGFIVVITGPPGATNYFTLDGTDPRLPGDWISPAAQSSVGPATVFVTNNVRIVARARGPNQWYDSWSGPAAATWVTAMPPLRITEINYHPYDPPSGSPYDAEDFEFIEVKNIGGTPLNVNRYRLSGGIEFEFPNLVLQPGQSAVVVKDLAAFASRYETNGLIIAGTFTGHLANEGDRLVLEGSLREPIHDFTYSDQWYRITDGTGFSLVVGDENAALSNWGTRHGWRASAELGGSPGSVDPAPPPTVLINEALTHADPNQTPGLMDAIELYNPNASEADIGGWFLTDDFNVPEKFRIPDHTTLAAGGYRVFTEADFNPNPGVFPSFALNSRGEEVYLFSADNQTNLTGYAHGFEFGAQANGVTFGRYVTSAGEEHFVAQSAPTLGMNNAGPLVGPVVITEIMYHPRDLIVAGVGNDNLSDEYIELGNISGNPVLLYDPGHPANTWHLRNAVEYNFPADVVIPASGNLLVVSFDPGADPAATAAFRARNSIPETVPLYGPWTGDLANAGDAVELRRPDRPDTDGVPSILVERVAYSNQAPWPAAADGFALSLQRIVPGDYGDEPTNWVAVAPSPGIPFVPGATPPVIVSQPATQFLVAGRDYTLAVAATGTPPLRYQWRLNGLSLPGATNSMLAFTPLQSTDAGVYNILVYNDGGSAFGTDFRITTGVALEILQQPADVSVRVGFSAKFSVSAVGDGPVRYQWYRDGALLWGATETTYSITNAQAADDGVYTVVVSDNNGTLTSEPARLTLSLLPRIVVQPSSATVAAGGTASFSVEVAGTPPTWYRWRRLGLSITNLNYGFLSSNDTTCVMTLTNVGPRTANRYDCVVSNLVGATPVSSNIYLVVVMPPTNQLVAPGTDVRLRAVLGLPPPMFTGRFLWQFNGTTIGSGTNVSTSTLRLFTNDLVLPSVTEAQSGTYTFLYTNAVTVTNGSVVSTNVIGKVAGFSATILVASDRDGDGMPDSWEILYGLNPDNPNDASQDKDGDGMTNLEEFLAGTDPGNGASALKIVEAVWLPAGQITFQFQTQSNRTYTVQYSDGLSPIVWRKLIDVPARQTNGVQVVEDPGSVGDRYYRVVTPIQP